MSERLVKIVTLDDVAGLFQFSSPSASLTNAMGILTDKGYLVEKRLEHYLLHITGRGRHRTAVINFGAWHGDIDFVKKSGLRALSGFYLKDYAVPHTVFTSHDNYDEVAQVFEELDCKVEKIE